MYTFTYVFSIMVSAKGESVTNRNWKSSTNVTKNITWKAKFPGAVLRENLMLRASRMLQVKNGTQHTRKEAGRINKQLETSLETQFIIYSPKTIANVCVALRSFLWLSFLIFLFFFFFDLDIFSCLVQIDFISNPSCVETLLSTLKCWKHEVFCWF